MMTVYALSPSEMLDKNFVSIHSSNYELGETHQLYTARGEQGMGTNKAVVNNFNVIPDGDPYHTLIRWYFTS